MIDVANTGCIIGGESTGILPIDDCASRKIVDRENFTELPMLLMASADRLELRRLYKRACEEGSD